jgi:glucose/arabinose dehydrogenase
MRTDRIVGLIALGALIWPAGARAREVLVPGLSDSPVTSGLDLPTAIAFHPDGRLFVTEKGGRLALVNDGDVTTLTTIPVCTGSEMGLLGVALDPNFAANGYVYLYRTNPGPGGCADPNDRRNQVVRVTFAEEAVDLGSLVTLVDGIGTDNGNHDGGGLRFGLDTKLYVAVGDTGLGDFGAPGESTNPYSQDLNRLEGKLLRVETDGSPAAGNPFIGVPGTRGEVFAYGFRNPFRFGIDPVTGLAWVGDVGQGTIEELDIAIPGGNYGWPACEGTLPVGCQQPGLVDPIFSYPHTGPDSLGRTIIGGTFADFGNGYEYFFADFIKDRIYRATPNAAREGIAGAVTAIATDAGQPVDLITGSDGNIYYVAFGSGEVRRLAGSYPSAPEDPVTQPDSTDRQPPSVRLRAARRQALKRLRVRIGVDEAATVVVRARLRTGGSSAVRFRTVRRRFAGAGSANVRLRLAPRSARTVRRLLAHGRKRHVAVSATAADPAGNVARRRIAIRLVR